MQKLGVFFLESTFPQGVTQVQVPWNIRSTPNSIVDGASSTIMMGENTLAGYSTGNPYSIKHRDQLGLPRCPTSR